MSEPSRITLAASVEILAAAPGDGPAKRPTFSIHGYTGAPVIIAGFYTPVIVDLSGLKAASQQIPVLRSHDGDRIVGQTESVKIGADGVRLTGVVTGDNADAQEVVSQARNTFKWQASIGADVVRREFLDAGKSATVNGRQVSGPMLIAREAVLREISFVALGADGATSATVTAKRGSSMEVQTHESPNMTAADPVAAERARVAGIHAAARDLSKYGKLDEGAAENAVAAGTSVSDFRNGTMELMLLRASRAPAGICNHNRGSAEGRGDPRQVIEAALLIRAGAEPTALKHYGERVVERARQERRKYATLMDTCEAVCAHEHVDVQGMNRDEIVRAAFSTLSLPTVLSNVAGKSLVEAYQEGTQTWRAFSAIKSAPNFQTQTGIRPSFVGNLEPVPTGGEVKHGTMAESTYEWQPDQYSKQFFVDRKHVYNDDIGFLDEAPSLMGRAAARTVNDKVFSTILANGGSFFSSGNGNLATGGGTVLALASFGARVAAMRSQRDAQDNDIQITPRVLLVPPELEATALSIINSTSIGRTDTQPDGNPWTAFVELAVESRLSNTAKFSGASTTAWYLMGGPMDAPFAVGFVDGVQTPTVQFWGFDSNPNVLALGFRALLDFGVAFGDYRAAQKAAGA